MKPERSAMTQLNIRIRVAIIFSAVTLVGFAGYYRFQSQEPSLSELASEGVQESPLKSPGINLNTIKPSSAGQVVTTSAEMVARSEEKRGLPQDRASINSMQVSREGIPFPVKGSLPSVGIDESQHIALPLQKGGTVNLSLIHISEPTRRS